MIRSPDIGPLAYDLVKASDEVLFSTSRADGIGRLKLHNRAMAAHYHAGHLYLQAKRQVGVHEAVAAPQAAAWRQIADAIAEQLLRPDAGMAPKDGEGQEISTSRKEAND